MKYLAFTFLLLLPVICSAQKFTTSVTSEAAFRKLAGKPLSSKYGDVASVKVILETSTKKLYYIQSYLYRYHYDFATRQLGCSYDLTIFNELNYSKSGHRDYLLANVNWNEASNSYYIDLSVFDLMPEERIVQLFKAVKSSMFSGEKLVFLLNTDRLMKLRESLSKQIATATPADIYARLDFQSISEGNVSGRLRLEASLDSLSEPLQPNDILITTKTPQYLPLVRGMVLTEIQTPLSHLVILGQNRGVPIAVSTKAFENPVLQKLDRQWVRLIITSDTFQIIPTASETGSVATVPSIHLRKNLEIDSLISGENLSPALAGTVGNKAANFGLLVKLAKNGRYKTPEASFAIPFARYEQHLGRSGAEKLIAKLVAHPPTDQDSLKAALKTIRDAIRNTSIDSALRSLIHQRLTQSGYLTFRFRSSTNAEDAAGFSGAGLYDSKTVDLTDPGKTAEEALQKVWASLWSYEAYMERSFYHIAQEDIAMGILVHRSFPDEAANGVAITENVYRASYAGFVVNVQLGDASVVAPEPGVICDQLVLYPANELSGFQSTIEVITTSNLTENGQLVMSKEELELLQTELERIKKYYWKHHYKRKPGEQYEEFGLDMEFKLDKETRQLYIKQVRIYNN